VRLSTQARHDRFGAISGVALAVNVADMGARSVHHHLQFVGDFLVEQVTGEAFEDDPFMPEDSGRGRSPALPR